MKKLLFLLPGFFLVMCTGEKPADLVVLHANIYTVDSALTSARAIAVRDGKFIYVGDDQGVEKYKDKNTQIIDAAGKFIMPGFIEGHGLFGSLGSSLIYLNFSKTKSWNEIVAMVAEKVKQSKPGDWILGRGWHQEKWTEPLFASVHGYPMHDLLTEVSPENPVLLEHASGHGVFANKKAMDLAGISRETPDPKGGSIVRDDQQNPIGMFEETAQGIVYHAYNTYVENLPDSINHALWLQQVKKATDECLHKGVTSFQDAGSNLRELNDYRRLAENNELKLRLWSMIRENSKNLGNGELNSFPWIGIGNDHFTVRAMKAMVDGALGSYGAWLLAPYADRTDHFYGQNTSGVDEIDRQATLCMDHNLQLCVHAIGDRANREVLNIMEHQMNKSGKQDLRWRIEHAQHIDTADIPRFGKLGVIASMQAIHCTSDAPFVEKRLGTFRARYQSYPWKSLLRSGALVTNGTDTPVEDVDPILSFYASVTRKRADNGLEFYPEQKLSREEGIYSYTLANAYAAFEENIKGSIKAGKLADFIMLSDDLVHCPDSSILNTRVLRTFIGGTEVTR
jgi:predicted amidohydrolase YtcJ